MKIHHYLTLLVFSTVVLLISAVEWSRYQAASSEQRQLLLENLSRDTSNFENILQMRIQTLRANLAQAASQHSSTSSGLAADSPFTAIAWLEQNSDPSKAKYKAVWAESNTQTFDPSWLKGLNFSKVKDGETTFVRRVDRSGNAFFAMVMTALAPQTSVQDGLPDNTSSQESNSRVFLFGAISEPTFAAWVDEWVGSTRVALVFDDNGNVISHSDHQYLGTNLSKDSFVSRSLRNGRSKFSSEMKDSEGQNRFAESTKIRHTNLRAALALPHAALSQQPTQTKSSFGLMAAIGALLIAITFVVSKKFSAKFDRASLQARGDWLDRKPRVAEQITDVQMEPIVQPEPELTFEIVEQKTKVNIDEILAKSKEIRERLQLDFIESIQEEQNKILAEFSEEPIAAEPPEAINTHSERIKVRRPRLKVLEDEA